MLLDGGLERRCHPRAARHEPLGRPQTLPRSLALDGHGRDPLAGAEDLRVQTRRLGGELANLDADLLPALEQPLELALDLLHRLPISASR